MKGKVVITLLLAIQFLSLAPAAVAATTWYVNGLSGSDGNDCKTRQTACKTIGHAISLSSSGDTIGVGPATYTENLTISISLKLIGSGPSTTIVDGGRVNTVIRVNGGTNVQLCGFTIRNGLGVLGGVVNAGVLLIDRCTISGNEETTIGGTGGGVFNSGDVTISNSTISGNNAKINGFPGSSKGGGIVAGTATLQNSILANNSAGNCDGSMTSKGYNLSSDNTCDLDSSGDLNGTDPKLGQLGNYGGPTQTIPLLAGSPAIDAGNPSGCTDGNGHLLKTDQRGQPRPDPEDTGGCDMGAYERQSD